MWGLRTPRSKLPSESKPGWRFRSLYQPWNWSVVIHVSKYLICCTTPYYTHISWTELHRLTGVVQKHHHGDLVPPHKYNHAKSEKKSKLNGRGTSHWCSHSSCQPVLQLWNAHISAFNWHQTTTTRELRFYSVLFWWKSLKWQMNKYMIICKYSSYMKKWDKQTLLDFN